MRLPSNFTALCLAFLSLHAAAQTQQTVKVELPPPLTPEQLCLLNVATFKYPEMQTGSQPYLRKEDSTLAAATPHTMIIADAVRMDRKRRSAYASEDGASYFIVDRGGLNDETHWYGPIAAVELLASCKEDAASTVFR